ncbi:MAG: hypothetical protein IT425_00370 [Pirellulales bacterium]|nr:hypothetical protein [Pirellulales bacterium]
MVNALFQRLVSLAMPTILMVVEKDEQAGLEKLKPAQRVAVIMALLGLTLIGLFLVVSIMLGGHWVRKLARHRLGSSLSKAGTRKANDLELRHSLESVLPEVKTEDTIQLARNPGETQVDGADRK